MTHTPGPWRVEADTTLIWGDCNREDASSTGMGYPIAECNTTKAGTWARGPKTYDEAEANARLIAAAPAMLAILRRVFATPGVGVCICGEDHKRALAIIARIDGAAQAKERGTD